MTVNIINLRQNNNHSLKYNLPGGKKFRAGLNSAHYFIFLAFSGIKALALIS